MSAMASDTTQASTSMTGIHAGDVLVRLRAISILPSVRTSDTLSALNVGVNNATVPELDFTYMIRDDVGVELILATSRHQVTSSLGGLGGVGVLPPTLLLQYHFNHAGTVRPYVGAGLNYTLFYNNGLQAGASRSRSRTTASARRCRRASMSTSRRTCSSTPTSRRSG
jgi:outer membrane protein